MNRTVKILVSFFYASSSLPLLVIIVVTGCCGSTSGGGLYIVEAAHAMRDSLYDSCWVCEPFMQRIQPLVGQTTTIPF
jgi:hypothetical protein